jgi:hypothetical protein
MRDKQTPRRKEDMRAKIIEGVRRPSKAGTSASAHVSRNIISRI